MGLRMLWWARRRRMRSRIRVSAISYHLPRRRLHPAPQHLTSCGRIPPLIAQDSTPTTQARKLFHPSSSLPSAGIPSHGREHLAKKGIPDHPPPLAPPPPTPTYIILPTT